MYRIHTKLFTMYQEYSFKGAFAKNERGYKLTPNFINAKDHFDPDSIRIQPIPFISREHSLEHPQF